ncbi:Cof-type HAD-IIB family hydrolase [Anaerostipes sp.]|uniref:Cof-type HAD-IIB family hydrolase n=1 Tax=Anaerostipes sp. TaxID=1872530 RepID=UPI003FF0C73D
MAGCLEKGKYKAVFSDIDGTLLNTSHQIPEKTKNKIQKINQEGIPFVLVSARMPKGMTEIRKELGAKSPMICYSGALVVDENDKPLYSVSLKKDEAIELCKTIQKMDSDISINLYSNDRWMVQNLKEFWIDQEMKITGVRAEQVSFQDERKFEEVHKILCMGDAEKIASLEEKLWKEFPHIRVYRSKDTYLEIMSMKASKSDAVHMLEETFDVTKQEIIAFGDNFNDIDMIMYAGLGVAMGNGTDEVKKAADYITEKNDQEGLRKVLDLCF